jgi:hypothetical protein
MDHGLGDEKRSSNQGLTVDDAESLPPDVHVWDEVGGHGRAMVVH